MQLADLMTKNRPLKGFIFTVDAVFSLIVSSLAISILLYVYFVAPSTYQAPQAQAASIIQVMQETTLGQIAQQGLLTQYFLGTNGKGYVSFNGYNVSISASLLQTMGELYLNSRGAYADILAYIINQAYNYGLFINNTYAPSLHVASFNGVAAIYTTNTQKVGYNYTVSQWFYLYSLNDPYSSLFGNSIPIVDIYNALTNNGVGAGQDLDFSGGFAGGSSAQFIWEINNNQQYCSTPANSILANRWYNVVVRVSNYALVTIYVNGVSEAQCTFAISLSTTVIPAVSIGANPVGTLKLASAKIANIQIYNRTLSGSSAATLYQEGMVGLPLQNQGLIGWWPLLGDPNNYANNLKASAYNVIYNSTNYLPQTLQGAYVVSKASLPMVLNISSNSILYNASVVIWR